MPQGNRFTVYDMLDSRGLFRRNPANSSSQDDQGQVIYAGPQQYPKMLFHPKGDERIIQEGEIIATPLGPKIIMQQRELIYMVVHNAAEEKEARDAGWHLHPSEAMRAAGKEAPATGADQVIADLKRKIEELESQRASLEAQKPPPSSPLSI